MWWSQERLILFSRGSGIIELLRETFCNAEIFIHPLQKIPPPLIFFHSELCQNHEQLKGVNKFENVIAKFGFFLSILKHQNERDRVMIFKITRTRYRI